MGMVSKTYRKADILKAVKKALESWLPSMGLKLVLAG
jgi:hypothetical protein